MATLALLSSLLLAALGVTAAAFLLHDHLAPQPAAEPAVATLNFGAQRSGEALSPSAIPAAAPTAMPLVMPLAMRARTRFVLLDARPLVPGAVSSGAVLGVARSKGKANAKKPVADKRRAQKAAIAWPWNLVP